MSNEAQNTPSSNFQLPLDELITYLGELTAAFETHPDDKTREAVINLLQGLDALHREAFTRLTAYFNEKEQGHLLLEAAESDRLIGTVLNLYDLIPVEVAVRQAEEALDAVRPYIESHGGSLKVLTVTDGIVTLEMGGACQGCAGATYTLQRGVRQALESGMPGFEDVIVQEVTPQTSSGLIGLDQIYTPPSLMQAPDFKAVAQMDELPLDGMMQVELEGTSLLLVNSGGEIFAVGAMCPGTMLPLSNGRLIDKTILCGWHNERFDLVTGACIDPAGTRQNERLPIYPVAINGDEIQVAVNVPARPPVMSNEQ